MDQKSKKNNFSEWYRSIIFDLGLLKYYDISGCYIMLPQSYKIWEKIQKYLDEEFKLTGVENVYFPLLISETNLSRESGHLEGFMPEVAWVTHTNDKELDVKLAIRPTSECAFYPAYAEIIKKHSDLPLKWNQWCNVLRWEFKDPTPFIRSREFLWNEGHSVFTTKKEAYEDILVILQIYKKIYENILCVPVIIGKKTLGEKFPGADDTFTLETYVPDAGRAIQCATCHSLGQNFSRIFEIKYQTEQGKTEYVWQTSWGMTTRAIGTTIMIHGNDNELILPSNIVEYQIVIVPIFKGDNFVKINDFCQKINNYYKNMNLRIYYDNSHNRPGWKFNYYETRGIPLRFEVGNKELNDEMVSIYCHNMGIKKYNKNAFMDKEYINKLLKIYDDKLFDVATYNLRDSIVFVKNIEDIKQYIQNCNYKLYVGNLCENPECENKIKDLQIKPMCRPLDQEYYKKLYNSDNNNCIICENNVENESICLFGRSF